jgi:ABC-type multidrug transport system ATPase subunit
VIELKGLTKRYGELTVLDDISLTVADGEAVALWGPNGAGKTTIVRSILGLIGYEGTVEINGIDACRRPKAARHLIGHVPQELSFYDDMTLVDTLDFVANLRRLPLEQADANLELVQLGEHRDKRVRELSGGMKQRLGIAAALLGDPPVLLLDEPTASLDVASRERMVEVIEGLRTPWRSIVLTSHDLGEVGMLVDRVIALADGRVQQECRPSELADRLGIRSWLHLMLGAADVEKGLALLEDGGFPAHANGTGLLVEVSAQRKAEALSTLRDGGVDVRDFEVWR